MVYSHEVENMCVVKKGPNHGPAPIPEEGKHHRQQRSKSKKSFHSHHSINMQLKNNRSRRYKEIAKSTNPKGNICTLIILFYERIIFCE